MIKKSRAKVPVNPYRSTTSPDDLGPADRIAFDIVAERRDLLPSVDRIMNADLEVEARVRAITLFRDSLTRMGDPHRDPRVAIMKSTSTARRSTAAARTT